MAIHGIVSIVSVEPIVPAVGGRIGNVCGVCSVGVVVGGDHVSIRVIRVAIDVVLWLKGDRRNRLQWSLDKLSCVHLTFWL